VGFIAPVAAIGILDYLFAADLLVNLEYRLERMMKFSRTSIQYIKDVWGVPEPYNMALFIFLSLLSIILAQKLFSKFFGRGNKSQ